MAFLCLAANKSIAQSVSIAPPLRVQIANSLYAAALESDSGYRLLQQLLDRAPRRAAGSADERVAAIWLEQRLQGIGFDSVWSERFPISVWQLHRQSAELIFADGSVETLAAAALAGSAPTQSGGLTARVIRINSFAMADVLSAEQVNGRIVFVDRRMVRAQDGRNFGEANNPRSSVVAKLSRLGAVAAIFRAHGTGNDTLIHAGGVGYAPGVTRIPAFTLSNREADRLKNIVENRPQTSIRLELDATIRPATSTNVIAELRGGLKGMVLAGAHIDGWHVGAADDAAGVITVLEAVRHLVREYRSEEQPNPDHRSLRVVFFGAEEIGLAGARAHVETYAPSVSMFAVESDQGAGPIYRLRMAFSDTLAALRRNWGLFLEPLGVDVVTEAASAGPDLIPFRARGAITFDLMQDMSEYFDYQHTNSDTLDKISRDVLKRNVGLYAGVLYLLMSAGFGGDQP